MFTFISAYRLAEGLLGETVHKANEEGFQWPGTRFLRRAFAYVPYPVSLHTALGLAQDEKADFWFAHDRRLRMQTGALPIRYPFLAL